jgi:hypothetical protein
LLQQGHGILPGNLKQLLLVYVAWRPAKKESSVILLSKLHIWSCSSSKCAHAILLSSKVLIFRFSLLVFHFLFPLTSMTDNFYILVTTKMHAVPY